MNRKPTLRFLRIAALLPFTHLAVVVAATADRGTTSIGTSAAPAASAKALPASGTLLEPGDFDGKTPIPVEVVGPDGTRTTVGVWRSQVPGLYILMPTPVLMRPKKAPDGYPDVVFQSVPPDRSGLEVAHQVLFKFYLISDELLGSAKDAVLRSPAEQKFLKDNTVDAAAVEVRRAPINVAYVELMRAKKLIAAARSDSVAGQPEFEVWFDLTDPQLADLRRALADGTLRVRPSLRYRGEAEGGEFAEQQTNLLVRVTESVRAELQKSADRYGLKDLVLWGDYQRAVRDVVVGGSTAIRTNVRDGARLPPLLASLSPDEFGPALAEGTLTIETADLFKKMPKAEAALLEYLRPLVEQELTSYGRTDLLAEFVRNVHEATESGGAGFSLPFWGGDTSTTTTDAVIKGLEKTSGTTWQKDETKKRYNLVAVKAVQLKAAETRTDLRLSKSILVTAGSANFWIELPPVPATLLADDVRATLELAAFRESHRAALERDLDLRQSALRADRAERDRLRTAFDEVKADLERTRSDHSAATLDAQNAEAALAEAAKIPTKTVRYGTSHGEFDRGEREDSSERDAAMAGPAKRLRDALARAAEAGKRLKELEPRSKMLGDALAAAEARVGLAEAAMRNAEDSLRNTSPATRPAATAR